MTDFYLQIQRIEQVCLFQLSWGNRQQLNVKVFYPENLTLLYKNWQRAYLNYYQNTPLRGRVVDSGVMKTPSDDWHVKLIQAEAELLLEFHNWLRSAKLYEIRSAIANYHFSSVKSLEKMAINIFLSCDSLELERLPWETWETSAEFALALDKIRIVRNPINIHHGVKKKKRTPEKARILVISGDETGLNFKAEKKAIGNLKAIANMTFVGWQPNKNIIELKTEIKDALICKNGWDILFFLGHSNESNLTGGEIGIAPKVSLSISEIAPALTVALSNGLEFALFNSCKGLSIANSLIDLGLSQVAVMREPIHNQVAEEFLLRFLQTLTEYQDVHEALISASQYLKLEKNLTYPSTYLIPSLFRHPDAQLFCLQPSIIKQNIKKIIPNRREAIALSSLLLMSLLLPVQDILLAQRLRTQAIYRHATGKIAKQAEPQVVLLQIDNESIKQEDEITNSKPISHQYLAKIIDKLKAKNACVIGIDYLLDRNQKERDRILAESLQTAVTSTKPTWFVFPRTQDANGEWLYVLPKIASPNWSLQGEIEFLPGYMELLSESNSQPSQDKPSNFGSTHFIYLLALSYQLQRLPNPPQPQFNSEVSFWQTLDTYLKKGELANQTILKSTRSHLHPLTQFSYALGQMWLHPIVDYSIPPNQVYKRIPAWQLLKNQDVPDSFEEKIVIVGAGGYREAGIDDGSDNLELPPAVEYWRSQQNYPSSVLTGSEAHAYMLHHLLNQRFVIPIPDFWMVVLAVLLSKYLVSLIQKNPHQRWQWLIILSLCTGIYGIASLQIYLSSVAILLPWFLPSLTIGLYITPELFRRKAHE
jgi:CHASE2 domain-containing sensor protein